MGRWIKERAVLKDQNGIHQRIISAPVFRRELTKREIEVLTLVAQGYKNREIAKKLGVAVKTLENHRVNIMNKLGLRNTVQMIRYAIEKGIVPIEDR
ncbi:response regulator transcription factor [Nitrospiraceae bacterium HYJII51-Mn-bac16s-1-B09]|uniref:Response regulator transcription factor n=1 Tax=Candidatus Manganitrophus noduliformans TaxID=2606439 RepID=A0A7X6DTU6_9BACT|nr:response regulator transcription factor [Candidatus Manganitrophus noduliformans]